MTPTWSKGGIDLYLGDTLALDWEEMGGFHALITDAPYGIKFKSHGQHFKGDSPIAGDESTDAALTVLGMAAGNPTACFFSPYKPLPIKWRSVLVWSKGKDTGIGGDRETCWLRDIELIGIRDNKPLNGKRDSSLLTQFPARRGKCTEHPAEKPVALMRYLVEKLTQPGEVVFDAFMGTGATAVAAIEAGRRFRGCEIKREWFDVAVSRVERALAERRESLHFEERKA